MVPPPPFSYGAKAMMTSPQTSSNNDNDNDDKEATPQNPLLFVIMSRIPYPFMLIIPAIFIVLIALGFSRPNIIEEDMAKLWIPTDGSYARNRNYAEEVGASNSDSYSTFAAMALSRHGDNLFTEEHLNTIKERMQRIESIQVDHKGNNFTWNDICFSNGISDETTYKFPCMRLSPMDLFEEANWYFTEEQRVAWYDEVKDALIKPLMIRYGVMVDKCISPADNTACDQMHSQSDSMTDLLKDIYNLEWSDSCRLCIEDGIDETIEFLKDEYIVPAFTILTQQLRRLLFELEDRENVRSETLEHVVSLIRKTATVATSTNRTEVEEFYTYMVIRDLYADMGALRYREMYRAINRPMYRDLVCDMEGIQCPPEDVTLEEAKESLLRHSDSPFSSTVTFGSPFPFFGNPDGTGHLFGGDHPVGGSGINMSSPLASLAEYLDLENRDNGEDWKPLFYDAQREDGFVDPFGGLLWNNMVASNPVYAWFMAGETEMRAHCGNGDLLGTNVSDITINILTAQMTKQYTQNMCTEYSAPFEIDETRTQQHFARMWYNLLIDSPFVLGITQGVSDPYSWTIGIGCGYDLGWSRFSYTGQSEDTILQNASRELYNIDEGLEIGVVNRKPLIGDVYPPVGEYSEENPLEHVGLLQNLYLTLGVKDIVRRVAHKNRPGGFLNITEDDAKVVLGRFKEDFEESWSEGWDNDENDVQFVGFFSDVEVSGTIGRFLKDITGRLTLSTLISVSLIPVLCSLFLSSCIVLGGAVLVTMAFCAAIGFGILLGINMNLTIIWSLPFVFLFSGLNNLLLIFQSLKQGAPQGIEEFIVPFTITSVVNIGCMLAIMGISNIPEVNKAAQVAIVTIAFVYVALVFCFPAHYLRWGAKKLKVSCCFQGENNREQPGEKDQGHHYLERIVYYRFYKKLIFGKRHVRIIVHSMVWALAFLLLGLGVLGINTKNVGMGLSDFLPSAHQGHLWASSQSDLLGTWAVNMNWPALNYSDPDTQMKMIKQFESVAATSFIEEVDTRMLWIAELAFWTTRQCDYNLKLEAPGNRKCGRDQVFEDSSCSGTWKRNTYGLREKYHSESDGDVCIPYDGGVCLPMSMMHPDDLLDLGIDPSDPFITQDESWCPVFEGWSQEKFKFCVRQWHELGGDGGLVTDNKATCEGPFCEDHMVLVPIPYSSGPPMIGSELFTNGLILEMMQQTREICDDDRDLPCYMTGAPYEYWSQYVGIGLNLIQISVAMISVTFGVTLLFLVGKLSRFSSVGIGRVLAGSLTGALLVSVTCLFSMIAVIGVNMLADVSLTAFTTMTFALSVCLSVEYSVHIVVRWINSNKEVSSARVKDAMMASAMPLFVSFLSTILGIGCLAFSDFEFMTRFFVRSLIITMLATYFFGCYWLPVFLTWLDFDYLRFGQEDASDTDLSQSPLSIMPSTESYSEECGNLNQSDEKVQKDLESNSGLQNDEGVSLEDASMDHCKMGSLDDTLNAYDFGGNDKDGESSLVTDPINNTETEEKSRTMAPQDQSGPGEDGFKTAEGPYMASVSAVSSGSLFSDVDPINSNTEEKSRKMTPREQSGPGEDCLEPPEEPYMVSASALSSSLSSFDVSSTGEIKSSGSSHGPSVEEGNAGPHPEEEEEEEEFSPQPTSLSLGELVDASFSQPDPPAHVRTSTLDVEPNTDDLAMNADEIIRVDTDHSGTCFKELPPKRSLSSPRKKFASTSPKNFGSNVESSATDRDNAVLNANAIYSANVQGYDFSTVLDESHHREPVDAPASDKRELLKGETTGETFSVHAAVDSGVDREFDTVKF